MSWNPPAYYMTSEDLADLVIESLHEQGYFKKGERAHPEDLVVAFTSQAEAIAMGAGYMIRKLKGTKNNSGI